MTTEHEPRDSPGAGDDRVDAPDTLDALVRAAAERPVDEAALTRRVLARVRSEARPRGPAWFGAGPVPAGALAAFVLVLAVTPIVVATVPLGRFDPVAEAALGAALGGGGLAPLPAGLGSEGGGRG